MRKITVILLGLMFGWFCAAETFAVSTVVPYAGVQTVIESSVQDELCCEREYNSNLGLPQTIAAEPVRTCTIRTVSCPERLGVRCGVTGGPCGLKVDCFTEFRHNLLIAGADAVDYYIFRLRRLLI